MRSAPMPRPAFEFYLARPEAAVGSSSLTRHRAVLMLVLLPLVALGIWLWSIPSIEPRRMTDLGLLSVLPPAMHVSLGLVAIGFALALRLRPLREPLMVFYSVGVIVMLFGVGALIHEVPRFPTTYVHAGIAEAIMRTGELFPNVDARFDWPIFFILLSFVTQILGFENPIELAGWVPALSNMLYLLPLLVIFGSFTSDRRLVWLSAWIFLIANWVGQDYLSPQGFNILLYLSVLAILLRWFAPPTAASLGFLDRLRERVFGPLREDAQPDATEAAPAGWTEPRLYAGLAIIVVLLYAVVVSSHQLTPFALLAMVTVLVLARRCTLRGLPIVMAVMLGFWLSFMSLTYLAGNLPSLMAEVGQADRVASRLITDRVGGSPEHIVVVYVRLALSAGVWLLAGLGALRRLRLGYWDLSAAILGVLPFGMVLLQSYGGELMLRVYLFALPFLAFFAAAVFYPTPDRASLRRSSLVAITAMILMVCLTVARYGNERAEYIEVGELTAIDFLHDAADEDALIISANSDSPLLYRDFEVRDRRHVFDFFFGAMPAEPPLETLDALSDAVRAQAREDTYLLITRSQIASAEMFGRVEPGSMEILIDTLRERDGFEVLYSNLDAIVFGVEPAE